MTASAPAFIPATKGRRYGSAAVVVASTALAEVSVLERTRPSPGKCLSVAPTSRLRQGGDDDADRAPDRGRREAVLPLVGADRRVPRPERGRHRVRDRGEVEVHAEGRDLPRPRRRPRLQRRRRPAALDQRRRERRHSAAADGLDQAALLVGGDEERRVPSARAARWAAAIRDRRVADPGRGRAGRSRRRQRGEPGGVRQRIGRGHADEQDLPGARGRGEGRQRPLDAGARGARRARRGGRRRRGRSCSPRPRVVVEVAGA